MCRVVNPENVKVKLSLTNLFDAVCELTGIFMAKCVESHLGLFLWQTAMEYFTPSALSTSCFATHTDWHTHTCAHTHTQYARACTLIHLHSYAHLLHDAHKHKSNDCISVITRFKSPTYLIPTINDSVCVVKELQRFPESNKLPSCSNWNDIFLLLKELHFSDVSANKYKWLK